MITLKNFNTVDLLIEDIVANGTGHNDKSHNTTEENTTNLNDMYLDEITPLPTLTPQTPRVKKLDLSSPRATNWQITRMISYQGGVYRSLDALYVYNIVAYSTKTLDVLLLFHGAVSLNADIYTVIALAKILAHEFMVCSVITMEVADGVVRCILVRNILAFDSGFLLSESVSTTVITTC